MKTKIYLIVAAIIFFTASDLTAVEDKIFTSSGQIVEGEFWGNVYIYNDDTIIDMLGGLVDSMGAYDASTVNVTGGDVSTLEAHEFSTVNVSGGYVHGLHALDHAIINFSDSARAINIVAGGDFGTVNITGGTVDYLGAGGSGTLNLHGGLILEDLGAYDFSTVNIYGYDLVKTASGGSYGYGQVYGFWSDGSYSTIDLYTEGTHSHINLFEVIYIEINIHPDTFNLQSKGKFMTCRIRLPEGYSVSDIDPDTILIERRVKAEWKWFNEKQNVVKAKFKRSELKEILEPGEIELIVSCHLLDGTYFEGKDTIKVVDKGRKKK